MALIMSCCSVCNDIKSVPKIDNYRISREINKKKKCVQSFLKSYLVSTGKQSTASRHHKKIYIMHKDKKFEITDRIK